MGWASRSSNALVNRPEPGTLVHSSNGRVDVASFAKTRLRMELDRVPLWRGDHVAVKQLVKDFERYLCLPRLKDSMVPLPVIGDGLTLQTWPQDSFGFADTKMKPQAATRACVVGKWFSLPMHIPRSFW